MSTTEYLNQLDYQQLIFARNEADRLIQLKDDEKKIPIWIVHDDHVNYACFDDGDHQAAAEKMAELVVQSAKNNPDMNISLYLTQKQVKESEYAGYMDLSS